MGSLLQSIESNYVASDRVAASGHANDLLLPPGDLTFLIEYGIHPQGSRCFGLAFDMRWSGPGCRVLFNEALEV
jgi:hypothetical protein